MTEQPTPGPPRRTGRLTAGPRSAPLWVVINAFDRNARPQADEDGLPRAANPWRSRMLGRVELALKHAGWTDAEGARKPVHLRALSPNDGLAHNESRGLIPMPMDRAQLRAQCEQASPRVLVLVGDAALEFLTGHKRASKYAGSVEWISDLDCWAVCVEDPFAWMMDHTKFHAAVRDLRKAVAIAQGQEPQARRAEITVLREYDQAMAHLGELADLVKSGFLVSCDIEAWAGEVRSIAFASEDYEATVLPLATIGGTPLWPIAEEDAIRATLRRVFALPMAQWVFQNAIFDDTVMHDLLGVRIAGTIHDTMARHNVLYPDQPKNLGFLVRWYLQWDTYHKDDAKAWKPNSGAKDEDLWKYNGVDADTTLRVWIAQEAETALAAGPDYAEAFRRELQGLPELYSAVREISLAGLRVDPAVLLAARGENQLAIGEFSAELAKLLGRPVWAVSPEEADMRAELDALIDRFGLTASFSKADGSGRGPMSLKRKDLLALMLPALPPGGAGPILAGMLGAGIDALTAIAALCTGKLPEGAFCFAQKGKVKELLYAPAPEGLGLKPQEKRRQSVTGATSTSVTSDTAALKKLLADLDRDPDPDSRAGQVITMLLALASLIQLEKAYFSAQPSPDGRFRGSYNIAGTTTRRLACNKWHDDTGFNLMTFPRGDFAGEISGLTPAQAKRMNKLAKSLKLAILPDDAESVIVNMDGAQAEARDVAYQSRDPKMIAAFTSGGDFHSTNAMNVWGFATAADVPKFRRQQVKKGGHGSNYLMGPVALARDMQSTVAVASAFQKAYYSAFDQIPLWHQAIRARLLKGLPIVNAFGWPRVVHDDPTDSGTLRTCIAHGPQSSIPMNVNRAWLAFRRLQAADPAVASMGRIMMQTHDSLTASIRVSRVDDYCRLMRQLAEQPIPVTTVMGPLREGDATSYVIPCDFEVGPNYGDMERYLTAQEEGRVRAEFEADSARLAETTAYAASDGLPGVPMRSDAQVADWVGVNKDAVSAVRAGRGRTWWTVGMHPDDALAIDMEKKEEDAYA